MAIETFITFQSSPQTIKIGSEDYERLETLGKPEEAVAVKLKELLSSVTEAVREVVEHESELAIEISGTMELKGRAGIQYLLFNVGTEASKANTMTVTLTTKVGPSSLVNKGE